MFYGHNHEDFIEFSNSFVDGKPFAMGFGNTALTTYINNNDRYKWLYPSFKYYKMNKYTYDIEDYTVYRMKLEEANRDNKGTWTKIYSFNEYYEIDKFNVNSAYKLVSEFYVLFDIDDRIKARIQKTK